MAKSKEKSTRKVTFARGGNNKMFGVQEAGPQKPGVSAHSTKGTGGNFARGGSTKMFGKQTASPAKPR